MSSFVLFDAVLERHVCESLQRALARRGHEVFWTGPVWKGHRFPDSTEDRQRIRDCLDQALRRRPDVLLNFRAASLRPELVESVRRSGVHTCVWLPDDPVLYGLCYREIVASYQTVLHCGGPEVLAFYERRHGPTGVNFPFWTDEQAFPHTYQPARAEFDLVFLGNCHGPARRTRYALLAALPLRVRIFGRVPDDSAGLCGGYIEDTRQLAQALAVARCGLSLPQYFRDYAGTEYDFPELSSLGAFALPARMTQYAAAGLPMVALGGHDTQRFLPEALVCRDVEELIARTRELLADRQRLEDVARATHRRFLRNYTADARAALLEHLLEHPQDWRNMDARERAEYFMRFEAERSGAAAVARPVAPRTACDELPDVEQQRAALRSERIESPRRWRILHLGSFANGDTDIVAALKRALEYLGHTVLHLNTACHRDLLVNPPAVNSGYGPVFVDTARLQRIIDRFRPQVIICNAGGLAFTRTSSLALRRQGILLVGVTLSDPDVQPSIIDHVANFDFHTTNSTLALERYRAYGLTNTFLMPFGIDRAYVAAQVEPDPRLDADVICLGHATNRPERQELMGRLAEHFKVRVYGTGWTLPDAIVVRGYRMMQASRAGRIHVNFPGTRAGYVNVKCGVFESIGSGAVLCTAYFEEMRDYFEYGTEIVGYHSAEDLIPKIRTLLAQPDQLERMRRRAFRRLVTEHLYEHRWLRLFEIIERDVFGDGQVVGPARAAALRRTLETSHPRKRKVVISGFYGAQNTGDELILRSIVEGVQRHAPEIDFIVASENPRNVEQTHALPAFRRTDLAAADSAVNAASAVVLGGGGLWHDYTFVRAGGMPSLFTDCGISPTGFAKIPLLARLYDRPFHVFGLGVGPLSNPDAARFIRYLARHADSITVRDHESRRLLEAIEGWQNPVECLPDPVFALDLGRPNVPAAVSELAQAYPILGVNLRRWHGPESQSLYARLAQALTRIVQRRNLALIGIPMQRGDQQDVAALTEVFDAVDSPAPRLVLSWTADFPELFGALSACRACLAMRLHACLLAHRLGRPTVGIAYDPKVRWHFAELGLDSLVLSPGASPEEIADALERALDQPDGLDPAARERIARAEERARDGIADLARRLRKAPAVIQPLRIRLDIVNAPGSDADDDSEYAATDDAQPGQTDLSDGTVVSGSLADPARRVPVVSSLSNNLVMFHLHASDPRKGDFAAYRLGLQHPPGQPATVHLRIHSPYHRPKNRGRLAYQLLLDGQVLLEEDVALWPYPNDVRILWTPLRPSTELAVRVVALRDCEPWSWGRAGRIFLRDLLFTDCPADARPGIYVTSPFSRTYADAVSPGQHAKR